MNPSTFEPKKSGNMVVRPLLPKEKDDYTLKWWKSLSLSYITLPAYGGGLIVLSNLVGKLFTELIDFANTFYLYVSPETVKMIETGKTIGVGIGIIMVAVGVINLIVKIFHRGEEDDD
jgi:transposase